MGLVFEEQSIMGIEETDSFHSEGYKIWLPTESSVTPTNLDIPPQSAPPTLNGLTLPSVALTSVDNPLEDSYKEVIKNISIYIEDFEQRKKELLKPEYKKLIFVIGNSGTGKSTLLNYLAGDDLVAEKVDGRWIVKNNTPSDVVIGHGLESQTFFPGFKKVSGTVYCDMPGFGDTRGTGKEIAKAIFMKSISDYVDEVKILVVIAYSDIDARAKGLRSLVKSLSSFIHHLNDLNNGIANNGIAIVVTKVDTSDTDSEVLQDISTVLSKFAKENCAESSFLQSVISQERLKIFRKPSKAGSLKDIDIPGLGKVFVDEQKSIQAMVEATSYLSKSQVDFGYSIISDAQLNSVDIARELQNEMSTDMKDIFEDIRKYYSSKIATATDIYELKEIFDIQDWSKEQFNFSSPVLFLQGVIEKLSEYRVSVNQDRFKRFLVKNQFLNFLQRLSEQIDKYSNYQALDSFLGFLNEERRFNQVLISLVEIKLSDESVIRKLYELKTKDHRNNEALISELVDGFIGFTKPQKLQINQLLDCILKSPESKDQGNQRIVVGQVIKLSEALALIKDKEVESLCICAAKAVIMDAQDLTLPSINVSILSPEWYMFGANTIRLDGKNGKPLAQEKANSGATDGADGDDGVPGNRGHNGGDFLGVGNAFYNSLGLTVNVNGGKGGSGQNGGDGHKGQDGRAAENPRDATDAKGSTAANRSERIVVAKSTTPSWFGSYETTTAKYKTFGELGGKGGNSGRGGKGGTGGESGLVSTFQKSSEAKVNIIRNAGGSGISGSPGSAGLGGSSSKSKLQTSSSTESSDMGPGPSPTAAGPEFWQNIEEEEYNPKSGPAGKTPDELNPEESKPLDNKKVDMIWYEPFIEYKKNVAESLGNKYLKHYIEKFIGTLNEIQGKLE